MYVDHITSLASTLLEPSLTSSSQFSHFLLPPHSPPSLPASSFPLSAFSGIGWPLVQGHLLQEHGNPTVGKPLKTADCPQPPSLYLTAFQDTALSDLLQVPCPAPHLVAST